MKKIERLQRSRTAKNEVNVLFGNTCGRKTDASNDSIMETITAFIAVISIGTVLLECWGIGLSI